jgi:hypothetical protein
MHNLEGKEEGCGVELGGVVCQDVLALQGGGGGGVRWRLMKALAA